MGGGIESRNTSILRRMMIVLKILLVLIIGFIGLTLYFANRQDKQYKEFVKRVKDDSKRESSNNA